MRRERECRGRESVEGERVWKERECGGRESVEGESGGRERIDRKEGVDEKKTEWRMKVAGLF